MFLNEIVEIILMIFSLIIIATTTDYNSNINNYSVIDNLNSKKGKIPQ